MKINRQVAQIAVIAFLLAILSVALLKEPFHGYVWNSTFQGFAKVLPLTAWTAIRVWSFWALASATIALFLKRLDPFLGWFDSTIGGVAGVWIFAYIAGNLLGPLGLFRSSTTWLIAFGTLAWLARYPMTFASPKFSDGEKLAILACILMAVGTLPLQLGSPIPPVMDVLNIPASAQRIVTFARFLPFDNDPYGYWTPMARVPALELFYAMLAMCTFTKLAVVAEMAALLPMSCLMIFATYRLGRVLMGDVAGGMASILLLIATTLTRAQSMRGTAVAFGLAALGLAFFIDPQRRPVRTAIGALGLATAVASHAIVGGLAMVTAGLAVLFGLLAGDLAGVLGEAACLFGAFMVDVPEFAIAFNVNLPYLLLAAAQLIGIGMICYAASRLRPRPSYETRPVRYVTCALILVLLWLLLWTPASMVMLHGQRENFPNLVVLSILGLIVGLWLVGSESVAIWVIAIALLTGCLVEYVSMIDWSQLNGTTASFGRVDVDHKVAEYWYPYFLVFPSAIIFDWIYRRWSKWLSIITVLALVMLPLGTPPSGDLSYVEHPLACEWANEWLLAKQGWWGGTLDTRWAQGRDELALNDMLRNEIRAGRITTATHIVHVTPHTIMYQDVLLFSLYTGIDDDLYIVTPAAPLDQGSTAGSRLRPISMLSSALKLRPSYLVVHGAALPSLILPPAGYDEIYNRGGVRLFRRNDLAQQRRA